MNHYDLLVEVTDSRVAYLLKNQVFGNCPRETGGIWSERLSMVESKLSIFTLKTFLSAYFAKESCYYKNTRLWQACEGLLAYIQQVQRADGTYDLVTVNFHSPPDTAFVTMRLVTAYQLLEKYGTNPEHIQMRVALQDVIKKAGWGMQVGGFHTPNHRWAISAALLQAHKITGETSFKSTAERFLAEGIDCDEEGEWTERSSGGYNAVCGNAFLIIAQELQQWEYLEPVRRNLEFMLYHLEPDGSIYTGNSTRQDQTTKAYPLTYYHLYLYLAYKEQNGRFAAMANRLIKYFYQANLDVASNIFTPESDFLYLFLLNPELKDLAVEGDPLPEHYHKHYPNSGLVRVRKGDVTYSITENNSRFLTFQAGTLKIDLQLESAFFAIGNFNESVKDERWNRESVAYPIEVIEDGYRIKFEAWATYFLPLETPPNTSVYEKMDHSQRGVTEKIRHGVVVTIKDSEEGLKIKVETDGCDQVPLRLAVRIPADSLIRGENFLMKGTSSECITLTSGTTKVSKYGDAISLTSNWSGPALLPRERGLAGEFTLYYTAYTNVANTLVLKQVSI